MVTSQHKAMPIQLNQLWVDLLRYILNSGTRTIGVRGRTVLETFNVTYSYLASQPVITLPERGLNYKFMAAEAAWIIAGDHRVEPIARYNRRIADFAPYGDFFFGAYGPKFVDQRDYVMRALLRDRHTRQAVMSFWTENPPHDADIACNDLLTFYIRDDTIHLAVTARSKDAWLGLPYDVFTFSMLLHWVACEYNRYKQDRAVKLGAVTFHDVNLHLYDDDVDRVQEFLISLDSPRREITIASEPAERGDWLLYAALLELVKEQGLAGF